MNESTLLCTHARTRTALDIAAGDIPTESIREVGINCRGLIQMREVRGSEGGLPRSTARIACPRKHRQTQDLLVEGLSVFKTPQHAHQHGIPRQGELVVRIQLKDFFIVIRAILEMAAVVGGLRRPARGLRCLALCTLDCLALLLCWRCSSTLIHAHTHTPRQRRHHGHRRSCRRM